MDPFLREMHIGLGCALENLLLAGQAKGYACKVQLEPDHSELTHVARVTLTRTEPAPSPLHEAIPHRHTNRAPYDRERRVPSHTLEALGGLGRDLPEVEVAWFVEEEQRRQLGHLLVAATEAIIEDEEQATASFRWFRHDWDEIQAHRDGLTLDTFGMPTFMRVAAKMLPAMARPRFDQGWLESTRDVQVATAAAFGVLAVADSRDNKLRLQGGRLWQRMHLWGTTQGLGMQPMSQITERIDREESRGPEPRFRKALEEFLGPRQPLMLFRLGYPTRQALASPRRPVRDVLYSGS